MQVLVLHTALTLLVMGCVLYPLRRHKRMCLLVCIGFFSASMALYLQVGAPGVVPKLAEYAQAQQEAHAVVKAQREVVEKEPTRIESWIRLGQALATLRQWEASSQAFKQAVLLSQGDPELIMAYTRGRIMHAQGDIDTHAKKSLDMVLLQKPAHEEARYYQAVYLLQQGKQTEAMQQMKRLYSELEEDSPVRALINSQIGR
jgi:cytochrome c-type biogenesis protein CcmH/NrfG